MTPQNGTTGEAPLSAPSYNRKYLWTVCLVAALGGLLFGYDWVVIGGAKSFFVQYFGLEESPWLLGWAMSSAVVGCILGSVLSGLLSDTWGRKALLILSGFVFTASAVGTALAGTMSVFVGFRILGGVGIGLASNLSPVYIAEVSPEDIRGRFVSVYQLAIVIGILIAQTANWAIARGMPDDFPDQQVLQSWYGQVGWRWMFGAETIPALLFFAMMFFMPRSPRWLVKNDRGEEAGRIITSIMGPEHARVELEEIRKTVEQEIGRVNFRTLLSPGLLKIVLVGMALAAFQQWCGINIFFYYPEEVFEGAGYNLTGIMRIIVTIGIVNLLLTVVAMYTVDRLGRRLLMLAGAGALTALYVVLGTCFYSGLQGTHILALVLASLGSYAFSLAPVTWVLLSEIFPNRIRGAAMGIAVFTLWTANWALTQAFPVMYDYVGMAGSLWIFGFICAVGFLLLLLGLPETKGKTLEQIERELVD